MKLKAVPITLHTPSLTFPRPAPRSMSLLALSLDQLGEFVEVATDDELALLFKEVLAQQ